MDRTAAAGPDVGGRLAAVAMLVAFGTIVLWLFGLPPRSFGILIALALFQVGMAMSVARDAVLDPAKRRWNFSDNVIVTGLLLCLWTIPAWIDGVPRPAVLPAIGLTLTFLGAIVPAASKPTTRNPPP